MRAPPPHLAQSNGRRSGQLDQLIATLRTRPLNIAGLFALLALLVASFSFFMPGTFPRVTTLQAMMFQLPELGLLSLAMAIPLISGGINLAIIATANQASLMMAWILTAVMPAHASGATLALWLSAALAAGLFELHHRRTGHRIAGGRRRHPSDPGDAGNHDLASWPQHLFHPRPHSVRLPRRLGRDLQQDDSGPASFVRRVWRYGPRSPCAAHADRAWGAHPHDRIEPGGDPVLRRQHAPRASLGLCHFQHSVLACRGHHDGPLQFGRRGHCAVIPLDHDPCGHPGRRGPLWRFWRSRRSIRRALDSSSRRERLQSPERQSSPRARFLGADPPACHGGQALCGNTRLHWRGQRSRPKAASALPLDAPQGDPR